MTNRKRPLGSGASHNETSDCTHDLILGPRADVYPQVAGYHVGYGRTGGPTTVEAGGCEARPRSGASMRK